MTEQRIERLNHLARKAKTIGLSEEEKQEQAALRRDYLEAIKTSLVSQLDNTYLVDEKGCKRKLKQKKEEA